MKLNLGILNAEYRYKPYPYLALSITTFIWWPVTVCAVGSLLEAYLTLNINSHIHVNINWGTVVQNTIDALAILVSLISEKSNIISAVKTNLLLFMNTFWPQTSSVYARNNNVAFNIVRKDENNHTLYMLMSQFRSQNDETRRLF